MSISLYKMEDNQIVTCQDTVLDPSQNYIIVDRQSQPPKIWVWRGPESNIKDQYSIGVSAIMIKTQEALYGASIKIVDGGDEPKDFPILEGLELIKAKPIISSRSIRSSKPIRVKLDEQKIRELAYDLSQQLKSYDDIVWLFAEMELKLENAFDSTTNPLEGTFPEAVTIYPKKILLKVDEEKIRPLAATIADRGSSLQDLHWFLAERIFVVENVKNH